MVTPIDAVSSGIGFGEMRRWNDDVLAPAPEQECEDPAGAVRGLIFGFVFSSAMWAALFVVGRALLNVISKA